MNPKSFRLSAICRQQLAELAEKFDKSETTIVEQLVAQKHFWEKEISMSKKNWRAVHPHSGKWQDVKVEGQPFRAGLQPKDYEWVLPVEFEDGTKEDTPLIYTNYDD